MNFVVDAQLPKRLARVLQSQGHNAIHTLDLPNRNRTPDEEILIIAEQEQRVIITKDSDFVESHVLTGRPEKLLLISTGNISNPDLASLLLPALPQIITAFSTSNFIEITRINVIIH